LRHPRAERPPTKIRNSKIENRNWQEPKFENRNSKFAVWIPAFAGMTADAIPVSAGMTEAWIPPARSGAAMTRGLKFENWGPDSSRWRAERCVEHHAPRKNEERNWNVL